MEGLFDAAREHGAEDGTSADLADPAQAGPAAFSGVHSQTLHACAERLQAVVRLSTREDCNLAVASFTRALRPSCCTLVYMHRE